MAATVTALGTCHHHGKSASNGLAVGSEDQCVLPVGFIQRTLAKLRLEPMRCKLVLVKRNGRFVKQNPITKLSGK
uniref:Uncharacterized protein n=1 Tax=Candidatus Kentrum sp. SD TaxID=2126332 RepID=A0A451BQ03_9GAMM|nr:MAG: hypothetical protein BECKSD772D_GA0070982_110214 [Candidatus Kentron sp. SD]